MLYNPAMQVGVSIAIIYANCTERAWADTATEGMPDALIRIAVANLAPANSTAAEAFTV